MMATVCSRPRLVLLLVLCLAGCASDSLAPGLLTGTYELRSIDGRPLPAVYDSSAYGFATAVRSALTFTDDGQVRWDLDRTSVFRATLTARYTESTHSSKTTLPFTLDGTQLVIGNGCTPNPAALCATAPMPGRVEGARLTLTPSFRGDVWTFERVDP